MTLTSKICWIVKLLPVALAVIVVLGHSKSDSLEAKGSHLDNLSAKNIPLMRSIGQTFVIVQKATSSGKDLMK